MRVILVLMALCGTAQAHDYFSIACCSDRDCKHIPAGGVTRTSMGWFVAQTGETVPFDDKRIRHPPIAGEPFSICIIPNAPRLICLYVPAVEG